MKPIYSYEFNSGRNALRVLVRELNLSKLFIPYYICPVVRNALKLENCEAEFYHIDENFFPLKEFLSDDYILYPDYFGLCSENIRKLEEKYKNLIIDNAHSFYSKHFGLASFNSCRKFFFYDYGVKDGACLNLHQPLSQKFNEDTFLYPQTKNNLSYNALLKNEKRIDESEILTISKTSKKLLSEIDFEKDKEIRLKRFSELHRRYKTVNEFKIDLKNGEIPFVYPLLIHDKNLQGKISSENELVFRYWTNIPESFPEYDFYKNLLPVPLI